MDILRRNTDYALRAMVNLARHRGKELMSARQLASDGAFPYQISCKILQKLHKAGLVESCMGQRGGFRLSREPSEITLMEIIEIFQGGIRLNRCLLGGEGCELQPECPISVRLESLQRYIDGYFGGITLEEILDGSKTVEKKKSKKQFRKEKNEQ